MWGHSDRSLAILDCPKESLCATTTAWSGIGLFLLSLKCLIAFFNRCAVRKSYFHFATKSWPEDTSLRNQKKKARRDTRVATLSWVSHHSLPAEDELRAGANFVDKEWELEHVSLSHLLIGLVGLFFCCGCLFGVFACLFDVFYHTWSFHIRLLDLPTISSFRYNDCSMLWCAQQWTKKIVNALVGFSSTRPAPFLWRPILHSHAVSDLISRLLLPGKKSRSL